MSKQTPNPDTSSNAWQTAAQFRHLVPADQPESVHEISEALYRPFVQASSTELKFHIAGCAIDPVPFVQMASGEYRVLTGQAVSPDHAESMGLHKLDQMSEPPAAWASPDRREVFLQHLDRIRCQEKLAESADQQQWIVWCNHFYGSINVEAGGASVEVPFSVWGSRLANGTEQCPSYRCPLVDVETYKLDVDDDGTITDADHILTCPETGRRLCSIHLEECQLTGQLVDPSVLVACPVLQTSFLQRKAIQCRGCYQSVNPKCISKGQCQTCRGLNKIKSLDFINDERLESLIKKQPWLKQANKVRLASQHDQWLIQCQFAAEEGKLWRILFDRHSGSAIQVSRSAGWLRGWQPIAADNWPNFLATGA